MDSIEMANERAKAHVRSLEERLEAAERERDSFLQSYENLDHRHNVMAERLEAAEAPHPCPICTPIHEENERLKRDLAISHAAQSASAEGWHQETKRIEAALALCDHIEKAGGEYVLTRDVREALKGEGE